MFISSDDSRKNIDPPYHSMGCYIGCNISGRIVVFIIRLFRLLLVYGECLLEHPTLTIFITSEWPPPSLPSPTYPTNRSV